MKKIIENIAMGLSFVGGLAWGILGLFNTNIVEGIFQVDWIVKTVYILVGVSAVLLGYKAVKK